jgi:hypothetical protein
MQVDMHFFGVYALARAAGIKPESARTIACSSQFVDDAVEDEAIVFEETAPAVLPTMTSHKPIDYQNAIPNDQWKVWIPFHFLPGADPRARTFVGRMVCRKNSDPAKEMIQHALGEKQKPYGPHLMGIAAHVFADTFAHYGFVGLSRDWNRIRSDSIVVNAGSNSIKSYIWGKFEEFKSRIASPFAESIPVGHGAVATLPDRPYLSWEYQYENVQKFAPRDRVRRENLNDYLEACEELHKAFAEFAKDNPAHGDPANKTSWMDMRDRIHRILKEEKPKEDRIDLWKEAILSDDLFQTEQADGLIAYDEKAWKSNRLCFCADDRIHAHDIFLYNKAAWMHRSYVLQELLPHFGLTLY